MYKRVSIFFFLSLMLLGGILTASFAQCTSPIAAFPYTEDFESNDGGWTTGGSFSDWAWGTPTKTLIAGAGSGSKCWITGGLAGSSYNGGERSWLQSPCFNFNTLQYPYISFLVFWETEKDFDGAALQYSTDEGITWVDVGDLQQNATGCLTANWFDLSPISGLGTLSSTRNGWSGNIQASSGSCRGGSGSGQWVTAKNTITNLAGQLKVLFRFIFGSGNTCNNYDGFAIDKIYIGDAPPNQANFSYTCTPSSKTIQFNSSFGPCPDQIAWNFDDPASGANNTSGLANPAHTFSNGGTYNVSLTVSDAADRNAPFTVTKTIKVISTEISVLTPVTCVNSNGGSALVTVTGPGGPFNYLWSTVPPQLTATATGLSTGTYYVNVSANNICPATDSVKLTPPFNIQITPVITDATCNLPNGAITVNASGGVSPYQYTWSVPGSGNTLSNLPAASYNVTATDASGCSASLNNIVVKKTGSIPGVSLGNDTTICPLEQLILSPGIFASYLWQDASSNATFTVTQTGSYRVTVTDNNGCEGTAAINVLVDCPEVFLPNAFSPNHDGTNDFFGPKGNSSYIKDYRLQVFNRWGQLIFESRHPLDKWDGTYKGNIQPADTFLWKLEYRAGGKSITIKSGYVILLH